MCWKPSFREMMPWRKGVLACFLGALFSGLYAQQPAADSTSKGAASQTKAASRVVHQVAVQSNGLPVPFATVFNTNTGQAAVANAEGVAAVPVWGVNDTCLLYTSPSPRDRG